MAITHFLFRRLKLNARSVFLVTTSIFLVSVLHSQENTLLYKVTSLKSRQHSYIFGTMHVMSPDNFFFPKEIEDYLLECDGLCTEIKGISKQKVKPELLFDLSKPLQDYCTQSQWDSIISWAETNLLMNRSNFEENFQFARPFVLMQLMAQNYLPSVHKSHEIELEKIASQGLIGQFGLESVDEQLNLFNKIDYPTQIEGLMMQLAELETSREEFNLMEQFYVSQNMDSLCSLTESDSFEAFREELLVNRNIKWILKMKRLMRNQSIFFAVGAGHLCGEEGLIQLLKNEGYYIEAIKL